MRKLTLSAAALLLSACASTVSTTKPVDRNEPRRVVGTENEVRVDGEVFGDILQRSVSIPVKYDVTNGRQAAIAIADIVPYTSYDEDTQTVTVNIGSEVPGQMLLPRLIRIAPGEKKSFSTIARVNIMVPTETPMTRIPRAIALKINFLGDTAQFEQLIAIPERGIYDPKLADELFPKWLERNETIYTNTLPMHWMAAPAEPSNAPSRRRRGRG
ncbi:MAG TPA: hypothetical protein VLV78_12240 [Thermoanaerobaculia bacterium]|nr:hypothetical protein [Thermoanaerobaculia bacterium]